MLWASPRAEPAASGLGAGGEQIAGDVPRSLGCHRGRSRRAHRAGPRASGGRQPPPPQFPTWGPAPR